MRFLLRETLRLSNPFFIKQTHFQTGAGGFLVCSIGGIISVSLPAKTDAGKAQAGTAPITITNL